MTILQGDADVMNDKQVILITGARKGIGKYLVQYYVQKGFHVI